MFFPTNPDLADILGRTDFDVANFYRFFFYFESPPLVSTLPQALFFSEERAPYFWKPLTCGYAAAGAFFPPEKKAPYFWKPLTCGYVAAGAFFLQKNGPHISGSP